MSDFIFSEEELQQLRFISNIMEEAPLNHIYLCYQLAKVFSVVFYPDNKTALPTNPFWDCNTKSPNREMTEKFKCAFVASNLYVNLKEQFEAKGYVIKSESKEPIVNKNSVCTLPYYPGISYILVPRT